MRWPIVFLSMMGILSIVTLLPALGFTGNDEPLDQLIARAQSARVADQPGLYIDLAQRELKSADQFYVAGKPDQAHDAVRDLVAFSDKAHDAAKSSGKKLKNAEIALRKMALKLRDIKRTQGADEQDDLQKAADHLEDLRADLLSHMFSKGVK